MTAALTLPPSFALHSHLRAPPLPQVDNRHTSEPVVTPEEAVKMCDRNFGIGGDGVSGQAAWVPGGGDRLREHHQQAR